MANGYYLDTEKWDINLEGRGRPIHWALALLITPIMGLLFIMFLPFVGFYLSLHALASKVARAVRPIFYPSGMAAGEAYLTGHRPAEEPGTKVDNHALDELSKEIDSRRK